ASVVLDLDASSFRIFCFLCHFSKFADPTFRVSAYPNLNEFLDLHAAEPCDFHRILHSEQPVKGRPNDVVSVVRSKDLRADVVHSERLHNSANCTACDNACTFSRGLHQHSACAVFADQLVRKRSVHEWHADQVVLRSLNCLLDRVRHFFCFSGTKTDVACLVTDHDKSRERKVLTALYDLRHSIDRDELILKDQACG